MRRDSASITIESDEVLVAELEFKRFLTEFRDTLNLEKSIVHNTRIISTGLDKRSVKIALVNMVDWGKILWKLDTTVSKIRFRVYNIQYKNLPFVVPNYVDGMTSKFEIELRDGNELIMLHDYFDNPNHFINYFLNTHLYDFEKRDWEAVYEIRGFDRANEKR